MAFIMLCCKSRFKSLPYKLSEGLFYGLFLICFLVSGSVLANGIKIQSPQLLATENAYSLSADFEIRFNSQLEEAVNKGVVLYFTFDFELTAPRWYWFDGHIAQQSRTYQLSYHALTRQYRLSTGVLHQSYATLDEALRIISRLREWNVFKTNAIKAEKTYQGNLRLRLDLSLMPKTFQVNAFSNKDWNLSSEWLRWDFTPETSGENALEPSNSAELAAPSTTEDAQ